MKGQTGRWQVLAAGAAIQILTGIPAAWGAFQQPVMEEYGFTREQCGFFFSLTIACYGVGCVLGGYLQDAKGPRTAGLWGAGLTVAGFCGAACVPGGAAGLFRLGFSLPVGVGTAFLTPAVMSCAQKWYPDRKGLATGVTGVAAGFSGGFLTLLVRWVGGRWGIRGVFGLLAALSAAVCGGGSLLLADPPPPKPRPEEQGRRFKQPPLDLPPARMLRTRDYRLIVGSAALATPAVLLFSPIVVQLGQERGLSEGAAHLSVVLGSVGSAAGRLLMPVVSDRVGRRTADLWLFGGLSGLSVLFAFARGGWVVACYAALTFCYSGSAALLPALGTDRFGLPHAGVNYGFLVLGMSAGSLAFPLLARVLEPAAARHWLAAAAAAGGAACIARLSPPKQTPKAKGPGKTP